MRGTWERSFLWASLGVLVAGMAGIGWWVGSQIEDGVVHQTAAYSALYVSSVVEAHLQELATSEDLSSVQKDALSALFQEAGRAQHITTVKVWNRAGRVVFSTDLAAIGQVFPIESSLRRALHGWVASDIGLMDKKENLKDSERGQKRLETYSPVRQTGTDQIIAAVEFYQTVDSLEANIATAQRNSWFIFFGATAIMYLVLAGFVRRASRTLAKQRSDNEELHQTVRRAARRATTVNERFLKRISAELHDGPAQDLGYALLRLDQISPNGGPDVDQVRSSLHRALAEIRAISAGMGLPELETLTLRGSMERAVRAHERRTGTSVELQWGTIPEVAPLSVKITAYRLIQEALSNAWRHAQGIGQEVRAELSSDGLRLCIADHGPGFDGVQVEAWEDHLGLVGMRERVESLGGIFTIRTAKGSGTEVVSILPMEPV